MSSGSATPAPNTFVKSLGSGLIDPAWLPSVPADAATTTFDPSGTTTPLVATDVQAAIEELDANMAGISSTAAATSFDPSGTTTPLVATNVQDALEEIDTNMASLSSDAVDITNTPAGNISATDVQDAINELDTEKQPVDATLTALAGLATGADKLPYSTGTDTFSQTDLTSVARTLIAQTTQSLMRTTGLGLTTVGDALAIASDAAAGRTAITAAKSGNNSDITKVNLDQAGLTIKSVDPNYPLSIVPNETLSALTILNLILHSVDRTIDLSGNLTVSSAATVSGTNTGDQTNISGNAATVTTNANLTGPITSSGNATTIADAELAAIAGLTSAANKGITFTGVGTAATYDLTAAALTVLDDTTVDAMVDTLGGASASGTGGLVRIAGPTFTGTPAAPTAAAATNTTQLATTAFARQEALTPAAAWIPKVISTTFNGATAIDASLGNVFKGSCTANFTLSAPTNPTNGQKIEVCGLPTGNYTVAHNAIFAAGIAGLPTNVVSGVRFFYVYEYCSTDTLWYCQVGA